MFETDLEEIEAALEAITVALDPEIVPGSMAQGAMERFARIEKMAHAGARLMGKRVADTGAWKNRGHQSPAHAMADAMGCSTGEAQRELGTANKLANGLEATDRAARRGELSPTQTGHVADAAAVDPSAEADLLGLAGSASAAELREESRRRRHAAARDDAERHRRIRRNRSLRMWSDDDGGSRLAWSHVPELGAEIGAILDPYIDDQFHTARKAGRREHRDAYAADAFVDALRDAAAFRRGESLDDADSDVGGDADDVEVADDELDDRQPHVETDASVVDDPSAPDAAGADPTVVRRRSTVAGPPHPSAVSETGPDPGGPAERGSGSRDRHRRKRPNRRGADAKVIVRIDHAALVRGHTEVGEICEIAGLGPVPVASVVALMDDAFLAAVITKGVDVVNVAHLGRRANAHQLTAIQANGRACTTLGCPNTARLETDHRDPYCDVLVTELANLDDSCPHCHDLKSYEGHRHTPGTGKRPLLSPAEQVEWNRAHPDNPIAPLRPPGRRGPTRIPPPSMSSSQTATTTPAPEALTLDL